jgi:1,4-dihydroxy-2-naphthoate octaprenyltransferase
MNASQIYILISIIALAIIAIVVILGRKKEQKPFSKLATFAFVFIMAGIIFGDDRLIGYSLIGVGVVLAIIDIVKKLKKPSVKSD